MPERHCAGKAEDERLSGRSIGEHRSRWCPTEVLLARRVHLGVSAEPLIMPSRVCPLPRDFPANFADQNQTLGIIQNSE